MKYSFAGNRAAVLKRMYELGLDVVKVWAVEDSYLEKFLVSEGIEFETIADNATFFEKIKDEEFDVFVSNGLPIILPQNILEIKGKLFLNVHPSVLPELRGRDPVPGALLYSKQSGATCHYMDAGIDTGKVISQVIIENTDDLDAGLLYQLSFLAEADAFEQAYKNDFKASIVNKGEGSYYSFEPEDLCIDLINDSVEKIQARIRAFATNNKGAFFCIGDEKYRCRDMDILMNDYLYSKFRQEDDISIILKYECYVLVKKGDIIIRFELY